MNDVRCVEAGGEVKKAIGGVGFGGEDREEGIEVGFVCAGWRVGSCVWAV